MFDIFVSRNAYSYIRFSSAEQAKGDSFRRQMTRTKDFCDEHKLTLNEVRYEDLGVSGWTGKNIERGALGDFIHALKAGKIEKGSVLIVENLDRFSRLKPRIAYNKLAEIVERGVDVVTLEDKKFHTKDTIDDFATVISSFAIMQRAHEESTRKSSMLGAAWEGKRQMAIKGKEIMTGHCPSWLRPKADRSGFEPIPERVKIVHRIIRWTKEGKGKREIARMLDAEKVPVWNRAEHWRENYILDMIKSRTLVGELQLCQKKKTKGQVVKDYYPAVIDEATWAAIQPEKRAFAAGRQSDVVNLLSGLLYDGYNPEYRMKVWVQNKALGYIYMQSYFMRVDPVFMKQRKAGGKDRKPAPRPLSAEIYRYKDFEKHFLQHFEEIDFAEIVPERPSEESSRLALLEGEKKENDKALANLIRAVEKGGELAVLTEQLKIRQAAALRLAKALAMESQKLRAERHAVDSFEDEQERMTELMEGSTREARLALRTLFHRIIDRIDYFGAGLAEVPENLKDTVYPERVGMMCYRVTMVGSYRMWIWEDGTQIWEDPNTDLKRVA